MWMFAKVSQHLGFRQRAGWCNLVFRDHARGPARWLSYHEPDRFLFTQRFQTASCLGTWRPPLSSLSFYSVRITPRGLRHHDAWKYFRLLAIIAWMPQTCNRNHSEQINDYFKHASKGVSMMKTVIMCHDSLSYHGHYALSRRRRMFLWDVVTLLYDFRRCCHRLSPNTFIAGCGERETLGNTGW